MDQKEWAKKYLSVYPPAPAAMRKRLNLTASTVSVSGETKSMKLPKPPPLLTVKHRSLGFSTLLQDQLSALSKMTSEVKANQRLVILKGRRSIFNDPWLWIGAVVHYHQLTHPAIELNLYSFQKSEIELRSKLKSQLEMKSKAQENQQDSLSWLDDN